MISEHNSAASTLVGAVPTMVLDLDGTLVDSVPDLTAAVNHMLVARGLAPYGEADVKGMVGDGTPKLVARAFAGRATPEDATGHADFLTYYAAHTTDITRPFPGVPETLATLSAAGWRLAVCTNKPEGPARTLLGNLGLAPFFVAVGGGDSFPFRKPDPRFLSAVLDAAGADRRYAVMVGDHPNDVNAAAGVGIRSIFAAWGYCPRESGAHATAVAERFPELATLAPRMLGL